MLLRTEPHRDKAHEIEDEDKAFDAATRFKAVPYQIVATAIIDMRDFDPEVDRDRNCEVLDHHYIPLCADQSTEMYFDEVVANVVCDEFDQIIGLDNIDEHDIVPGVYRYVFSIQIDSSGDGVWEDYDEHYLIELISRHKYGFLDEHWVLKEYSEDATSELSGDLSSEQSLNGLEPLESKSPK